MSNMRLSVNLTLFCAFCTCIALGSCSQTVQDPHQEVVEAFKDETGSLKLVWDGEKYQYALTKTISAEAIEAAIKDDTYGWAYGGMQRMVTLEGVSEVSYLDGDFCDYYLFESNSLVYYPVGFGEGISTLYPTRDYELNFKDNYLIIGNMEHQVIDLSELYIVFLETDAYGNSSFVYWKRMAAGEIRIELEKCRREDI